MNYDHWVHSAHRLPAQVDPHYQLVLLLTVYDCSDFDPVPIFDLPIAQRAQRVHVRATGQGAMAGHRPCSGTKS